MNNILFNKIKSYKFLKDNIYLLALSFLLLSISIFTRQKEGAGLAEQNFVGALQTYINTAENEFENWKYEFENTNFYNEDLAISKIASLNKSKQLLYLYDTVHSKKINLLYWNNTTTLPDSNLLYSGTNKRFVLLSNGYYFFQKHILSDKVFIALLPIKWNFLITNQYLKNEFLIVPNQGNSFAISTTPTNSNLYLKNGSFLFGVKPTAAFNKIYENDITIYLRLTSLILFLFFLQFTAAHVKLKHGLFYATIFLFGTLLGVRILTYVLYDIINLRQFELFDPSIYGSNFILKSLGDLLINILLLLWIVLFVKNNLTSKAFKILKFNFLAKTIISTFLAFIILFVTYISQKILKSIIADSQISFDVMNFFSLDIYSVIGFLVLCAIAVGYYYFCNILFFVAKRINNNNFLHFFITIAIAGLFFLSTSMGKQESMMEFFSFFWLLFFLLLINFQSSSFINNKSIFSKSIFWLFFFSITITSVIINENAIKELNNRKHYAEVITTKTNSINEAVLNTILTEFRPSVLALKFSLFNNAQTANLFKDSLLSNNFNTYTNNYETKILLFNSKERALFNSDAVAYNTINSILITQGKPTSIQGLYYFDKGYDKFSYVSKREIKNTLDSLLGYIFIVISPKKLGEDELTPTLFSRSITQNNALSNTYDYAIYKGGKLLYSQNDYAFTTSYNEKKFLGNQFLQQNNGKFNELWYNAGAQKFVVVVKENRLMFELITLLSFIFCSFVLFNSTISFLAILLNARFKWRLIKEHINFSIKQQVQTTIISFSILSFIVIGVATIIFFTSKHETNNKFLLSSTSKLVAADLAITINKLQINNTQFAEHFIDTAKVAQAINTLSKVHKQEINLYDISGNLKASSLAMPYLKGIVSVKMHSAAFNHLHNLKEIYFFQAEQIGTLKFVSSYIPILDSSGNQIAFVNIPFFTSQSKLKQEISSFLVTIIILNAFILLIAGVVALIITNRITNSFSFISDKMKQINLNKQNEIIQWHRKDEIGALVKEYNKMVTKLDDSAALLARNEREYAWQEMAKQIAHEIKNPLTPMKLSMQFLQKAINDDAPNVKELSTKVSATLVEQIDHLSNIANEFSQFANIEKVTESTFDINEVFISLKELYHASPMLHINWKLAKNPMYILADKTHINRIFTNLILNAIQSVSEGLIPTILIEQMVNQKSIIIKVSDNGSGIPDSLKDKIFMPNFTTKSSGTGLGLSMCKRMVEQAKGTIYFETSSTGTAFFVTFPLLN